MKNIVMHIFNRVACIIVALMLGNVAAFAISVENGKTAYVKQGCWQCHGFEGQGSLITSGGTVLSRTTMSFDIFKSFVRNSNRTMPPYREAILSDADLADIFAYMQSIPQSPDPNSIPLLKQ